MKNTSLFLLFFLSASTLFSQSNVLMNSGFETSPVGNTPFVVTNNGSVLTSAQGLWQLTFVTGSCSGGCSSGTSQIVNTTQNSGSNAISINIAKQTNRNDIRLFQTISSVPSGRYTLSFYAKSDIAGYPLAANVFKSTDGITSNGADPFLANFTTTTAWKRYSLTVDMSAWTTTELTNMRISMRPNTSNAVPTGTYPKTFWIDDVSFKLYSPLDELKQIAIDVAQERQILSANAGYTSEATALSTDIATLINSAATAPIIPAKAVGFNPPLQLTTAATNPFIASMNTWAAAYLAQTFTPYSKATASVTLFPSTADCRTIGEDMERLYWLITSPNSTYQYNSELFRRFLHLVYATSDDYKLHGNSGLGVPSSTANAINDWFAAPTICYSWRMAETSFGDYIPTTMKQQMQAATNVMGTLFRSAASAITSETYTNRDISYAEVLMHAGMYVNNANWLGFSKTIIDITNADIYPDGAYSYLGKQNECASYHGATNNSLAKMWAVSEYQPALDCMAKSANYEPLSIEGANVPEFYTAPAWKTQWNSGTGASGEALLSVTGNGYLKTKLNQHKAVYGYDDSPLSASFYRTDITALPIPTNYVVYDRNIQGPRARYGRFSYGLTTRSTAQLGTNTGLQTMVGAIATEAGTTSGGAAQDELNAALMAVHSKVHVRTNTNTQWQDWAYMSANTAPKTCVSATAATASSPSTLQYQSFGPVGYNTNWGSFQQWITLPDRVVGIVETYPLTNTTAMEIDGRVRFTYGRTGSLNPKNLVTNTAGVEYTYGNLKAFIHEHNFTSISTATAGVLRDDVLQAEEIVFRYGSSSMTSYTAAGFTRRYFIVEIRNATATGTATVTRIDNADLKGLVVKLNGKSYTSLRNNGGAATTVNLSNYLISGNGARVFYPRDDAENTPPTTLTVPSVSVPSGEQILVVSSLDGKDLAQGWSNYDQTLATQAVITPFTVTPITVPVELIQFKGTSINATNRLEWTTAQERNADYFEVQRSADGKIFDALGQQKATNTSRLTTYIFEDKKPLPNVNYYRLRMVDNDNSFKYSPIVALTNGEKQAWRIAAVYPVPSKDVVNIDIENADNQSFTLILFDILGREQLRKVVRTQVGFNKITLPKQSVNAYILQIVDDKGRVETMRL
jgi:hypothetical protein